MSLTFRYVAGYQRFNFDNIDLIEDPLLDGHMEKETFIEIYSPLLEELNGQCMTSFVDFYFMPSPLASNVLIYVDKDAKLDFRDQAEELGLNPKLKEVMEGENESDRKSRMNRPQVKKVQSLPLSKSADDINNKRREKAFETLEKLNLRLSGENNPVKRKQFEIKMRQTQSFIDSLDSIEYNR